MIFQVNRNKRILFLAIAMLPVVIPVLLTAFELISTEKESVVFLEGYPTSVSTLVLLYYLLLLIIGASWLIKNFISLFQLKNEKARTEMMHLKSQVNPHFFFNTLNNLYGLIGTDPSKAQLLTLKLSDMMRYSIYEGERDRVTLKEEVNYL
ncbi:MAG: histidine kinase, partial [Saprospiraceae bacterium]|nr:histidine kinase [Saprospiraceae bacterium]